MNEAPETIYIINYDENPQGDSLCARVLNWKPEKTTQYVRADLVPQWQSIETAPKDTAVLTYDKESGEIFVSIFDTRPVKNCWQTYGVKVSPTHWMPLPKGPSE